MAKPAKDIQAFFNLPEVQRLLTIARSDNALIALAVQRREISWTQFMAWLLDPDRVPAHVARERTADLIRIALSKLPGQATNPHARRLVQIRDKQLDAVIDATPEQSVGKAGRIDLVVCTRFGEDTLRLLIENKIDADEHAEQLAGYVAHYQRKHAGELFLPILIDLGDSPAEQSTCPWAPCLDRSDIADWLSAMRDAPTLAQDYLAMFEAWDIGLALPKQYQSAIDRYRSMKNPPTEWRLIEYWLSDDGRSFYQATFEDPVLTQTLADHGFDEPESVGRMKSSHGIVKLAKPSWTLYPCGHDQPGVQVHFECDGRGKLRLDIEVYPYVGSIEKKPDRMAALAKQLELKAKLHAAVRPALTQLQMPAGVRLGQRKLSPPETPKANSAGRFVREAGEECTPGEYAGFISRVVHAVSPGIDEIVSLNQRP